MKIICVGGGPAGLYFAILAKRRYPQHEVVVLERNPAGATFGWGVVFWDDFLDSLYRNDPESAREVREAAVLWEGQEVRMRGERTAYLGGYGFSMSRRGLLEILARRARALGVDVRFECEATDVSALDADLVVAGDGVNSGVRDRYCEHFGTSVAVGHNRYVWLGTSKVFDSFVFAFEQTPVGWIWFHAYPSSPENSTCIVECTPETWSGLGFDELDPDKGTRLLEEIFAGPLDGHRLINQTHDMDVVPWLNFREISNRTWRRHNIVLMGDAAHTTHFTIGSGTKLAIQDAIGLADVLPPHVEDLPRCLQNYDEQRRAALLAVQDAAHSSMTWFENVDVHIDSDGDPGVVRFAYSLWKRRGHYPVWRYQLHLATQIGPLRRVRQGVSSARRAMRARRRGELPVLHPSP